MCKSVGFMLNYMNPHSEDKMAAQRPAVRDS